MAQSEFQKIARRLRQANKMARPARLELTTCRLGGGRSVQMSYGRIFQR